MRRNTASATAYTVAQGILFRADKSPYDQLLGGDALEALRMILNGTTEGRRRLAQIKNPVSRILGELKESILMPGVTLHHIIRKRYIEDKVRAAIARGAMQVVVLGGGFDTLAYRLSATYEAARFIEIDHPVTSKDKIEALHSFVQGRPNIEFIAADLGERSIKDVLGSSVLFDINRETIFVCEGVLMYLTEQQVRSVFLALRDVTRSKVSILFSFMEEQAVHSYMLNALLTLYLRFSGEPFTWSLKGNSLEAFLSSLGYNLDDLATSQQLLDVAMEAHQTMKPYRGEMLALCSFNP